MSNADPSIRLPFNDHAAVARFIAAANARGADFMPIVIAIERRAIAVDQLERTLAFTLAHTPTADMSAQGITLSASDFATLARKTLADPKFPGQLAAAMREMEGSLSGIKFSTAKKAEPVRALPAPVVQQPVARLAVVPPAPPSPAPMSRTDTLRARIAEKRAAMSIRDWCIAYTGTIPAGAHVDGDVKGTCQQWRLIRSDMERMQRELYAIEQANTHHS